MIAEFTYKENGETIHTFLSNFFVEPDGSTVEHEYQAAKTLDLSEKLTVLRADTPGEAKKLGRRVTLREDWEEVKDQVMTELVLRKFFDHPNLRFQLLDTGDDLLVEVNWWHDNYWGACECPRCVKKSFRNMLGRTLMDVREALREDD